ncbi:TPA: N-acetyltransferase [Pseudomonas aeruginosa]|uniref:N-acetyltransferase n=1 Tax=Pseudomonas aeruginosa TaxID=287 RepID=UPI000428407D|nr:N-acetyltransferase [Pseudomonas aeruginosa]EKT9493070.1 N-acetyltransferase [Pseudomonas aeruginosa]MBH4028437.1 N-acetyltransferase [Pseudomonas aeruginosa]MBV5530593.1 N-acetyltransferase [Pseudomonas aeruginosa]MCS8095365.1 N-acetyltransferase [Pseudomonas aeruginosa]RTS98459.1 N-acetyltransferase [Pseudomonas aeruginosa]
MSRISSYEFVQMRSAHGEAAFFSQMGYFFASPSVRRECGGYALNDGPLYRWFVVRRKGEARILGFISIEQRSDIVRLREGYLRAEARGRGLFGELRRHVLEHVDGLGLSCTARVQQASARFLEPHGFNVQSSRGSWVTLERQKHAASHTPDEPGRSPVHRTGQPAVVETG